MTIDEAIRYCEEMAEQNDLAAGTYKLLAENNHNIYERLTAETNSLHCAKCSAVNKQLAKWLTELKETLELILAYKAKNAALREFTDKIYDVLAEQIGCPCNFSPIDEYMLKNGGCDDCCGTIPDKECWSRYLQTKIVGGIENGS